MAAVDVADVVRSFDAMKDDVRVVTR